MDSATHIAWSLVGRVAENEPARSIPICGLPFTIGRRSTALLSIPNKSVSGVHAEIRKHDGTLWLHDLGSTNGTFWKGVRVTDPVKLCEHDLVQFGQVAFRLERMDVRKGGSTLQQEAGGKAVALAQFDKLLSEGLITPYFQPIVDLNTGNTRGLEALARSEISRLRSPEAMFRAAKELDVESELSNMLRLRSAEIGCLTPEGTELFFNAHPREAYIELAASLDKLRQLNPDREMTLEISSNSCDLQGLRELRSTLHLHRIRLAYDDFGAGSEQLDGLFNCPPDYLKFDVSVVRDIDTASPERQKSIAMLVQIAGEAGAIPLAVGIETAREAETCRQLGFALAQGFHFGRPSPVDACQLTTCCS